VWLADHGARLSDGYYTLLTKNSSFLGISGLPVQCGMARGPARGGTARFGGPPRPNQGGRTMAAPVPGQFAGVAGKPIAMGARMCR
jgi:hypothetical protein